ncbi:MAG TPA: polyprenyl synthetase family protein [Acidimicrobiales bacterium]|nr:polyprenyl synthetase family protein [Acidimicrobiales bacterium]
MDNAALLVGVPGVEEDLRAVELRLSEALTPDDPFLAQVASHLAKAGGKRLRPALAVASARASGAEPTEGVIDGAVAVELVHQGSLYHDDVMDSADLRHGVESANRRWGNLVSILTGDFLLARASEMAAALGSEVAGLLASTIARMCEGQVRELSDAFNVARTEANYLLSIEGKTAALWSASCRTGALTAGMGRADIDAFTAFGRSFGMVFQICDDILDVIGTDEELGKPAGNDLMEGVYTLPVLRTLADADTGGELRDLLGGPLGLPERDKARQIVRNGDGVAQALDVARRHAADAADALSDVPGEVAATLSALPARLVDRHHR